MHCSPSAGRCRRDRTLSPYPRLWIPAERWTGLALIRLPPGPVAGRRDRATLTYQAMSSTIRITAMVTMILIGARVFSLVSRGRGRLVDRIHADRVAGRSGRLPGLHQACRAPDGCACDERAGICMLDRVEAFARPNRDSPLRNAGSSSTRMDGRLQRQMRESGRALLTQTLGDGCRGVAAKPTASRLFVRRPPH